jgi:intracellular sulfur oxidation DsrE/DsrF family protein
MTHQVVFHIDDLAKWQHALGNVANLITFGQATNQDYQIVVLVNGDAILGYLEDQLRATIAELTSQAVQFHACQNAMNSHSVKKDQLPVHVKIVPAGVADLISLQEAGYAYIKP